MSTDTKIGVNYTLSSNNISYIKILSGIFSKTNLKVVDNTETQIANQKEINGSIVLNGTSDALSAFITASNSLYNNTDINVFFDLQAHYEEYFELKSTSSYNTSFNYYKFASPLLYKNYVKNYENYLNNNSIKETTLPLYADLVSFYTSSQPIAGENYYDVPNKIINNNIATQAKNSKIILTSNYDQKNNSIKDVLKIPFYSDIKFDFHPLPNNGIVQTMLKKDVFDHLLNFAANNLTSSTLNLNDTNNKINIKYTKFDDFLNYLSSQTNIDWSFIFNLNKVVYDNNLSFKDVLSGQKQYTEVLGYHLAKYEDETNALIQEWYIPNLGSDFFNYIDTQIKNNKKYTYRLNQILLNISATYKLTNTEKQGNNYKIDYVKTPSVNILLIDDSSVSTSYVGQALSDPPLEPEIEFIPFVSIDNKIKINLYRNSFFNRISPYITISDAEEEIIKQIKISQNRPNNDKEIMFKNDKPIKSYVIYRLEQKPKSYADFMNADFISTVSGDDLYDSSLIQEIVANQKYYFTVRSLNVHGLLSNPTSIYEVELTNDNGLILPSINLITLSEQPNNKTQSKTLKRYLKIRPSLLHTEVNYENSNQNNIELGLNEKKVWDTKFKARLISKSTGKKIDINFKFKYKKPE